MVDGNNVWNAGQPAERQNDASKPTPDGDMAARDAIVSPVAVDERGHLDKKDNCNNNVGEKPQTLNLEIGVVLNHRWQLTGRIGKGAFGDIFAGCCVASSDNQRRIAIKIESLNTDRKRSILKFEASITKRLQSCPFVARYFEFGVDAANEVSFFVMERLGDNMLKLVRRRPETSFSLGTLLRIGIQGLTAIRCIHESGFLHRDIKPSNFVTTPMRPAPNRSQVCYIIDFGLAKLYRNERNEIVPARKHVVGFRGTPRYASLNIHKQLDCSRRDDLWSFLYMLVELWCGRLPWANLKDREEIARRKQEMLDPGAFLAAAPRSLVGLMQHILSLEYEDTPNYDHIIALFETDCLTNGIHADDLYDWEEALVPETAPEATVASTSKVAVVSVANGAPSPLLPPVSDNGAAAGPNCLSTPKGNVDACAVSSQARGVPNPCSSSPVAEPKAPAVSTPVTATPSNERLPRPTIYTFRPLAESTPSDVRSANAQSGSLSVTSFRMPVVQQQQHTENSSVSLETRAPMVAGVAGSTEELVGSKQQEQPRAQQPQHHVSAASSNSRSRSPLHIRNALLPHATERDREQAACPSSIDDHCVLSYSESSPCPYSPVLSRYRSDKSLSDIDSSPAARHCMVDPFSPARLAVGRSSRARAGSPPLPSHVMAQRARNMTVPSLAHLAIGHRFQTSNSSSSSRFLLRSQINSDSSYFLHGSNGATWSNEACDVEHAERRPVPFASDETSSSTPPLSSFAPLPSSHHQLSSDSLSHIRSNRSLTPVSFAGVGNEAWLSGPSQCTRPTGPTVVPSPMNMVTSASENVRSASTQLDSLATRTSQCQPISPARSVRHLVKLAPLRVRQSLTPASPAPPCNVTLGGPISAIASIAHATSAVVSRDESGALDSNALGSNAKPPRRMMLSRLFRPIPCPVPSELPPARSKTPVRNLAGF